MCCHCEILIEGLLHSDNVNSSRSDYPNEIQDAPIRTSSVTAIMVTVAQGRSASLYK